MKEIEGIEVECAQLIDIWKIFPNYGPCIIIVKDDLSLIITVMKVMQT